MSIRYVCSMQTKPVKQLFVFSSMAHLHASLWATWDGVATLQWPDETIKCKTWDKADQYE